MRPVDGSLVQLGLISLVSRPGRWRLLALGGSLSAAKERRLRRQPGLDDFSTVEGEEAGDWEPPTFLLDIVW